MRVVEPHQFKGVKKTQRSRYKYRYVSIFLVIVVLGIAGLLLWQQFLPSVQAPSDKEQTATVQRSPQQPTPKTGAFKVFSGEEFKKLYQSVAYPNIISIEEPISITGNAAADERIRKLAEERGYLPTAVPAGAIVKINEPRLENDDLLQPLAAEGWQSLKSAAAKDGLPLSIISAYRSPEYQRNLFVPRLYANGTNPKFIVDGIGDPAIRKTLEMTAVPGYSRHHTGYTIDLWCEDGSKAFLLSTCYKWISANNYLKAKESGWIPSYPEGTDLQGPEPEPWEYVWVGTDLLRD